MLWDAANMSNTVLASPLVFIMTKHLAIRCRTGRESFGVGDDKIFNRLLSKVG